MIESYDWKAPDVQAHWETVRSKIREGQPVGLAPDPDFDLRSARKQLANCERDAEEWRTVIARLEARKS